MVVLGSIAGVLALIAGGLWLIFGSPWLAATTVRVEGNTLVSSDEVVAAAAVPLGTALAGVDTAAIQGRVRESVPAIAQARVTRSWPSTVVIQVTEWTPRIVLEVPGSWVWISGEGRSFHTSNERPPGVMIGRGNLGDENVLTTLATVAQDLPPDVQAQADHIEASTVDSVTITLADKRRIVWGSAEDGVLKRDVLEPLLKVNAKVYDVSAPSHPTTR